MGEVNHLGEPVESGEMYFLKIGRIKSSATVFGCGFCTDLNGRTRIVTLPSKGDQDMPSVDGGGTKKQNWIL